MTEHPAPAGHPLRADPEPMTIPVPAPLGSGAVEEAVAIWRTLVALGVRHVAISPGSRSAPLVYALEDPEIAGRLEAHVRIDERAAAFTALGISRRDPGSPGVVVTTSGTATAHLHAAVLEAHHSRTPLIVLTADRPIELRGVGANQATHQVGIYGDAVRFATDLPAPSRDGASEVELRTAVSTLARAFAAATGPRPGPVHVNLCLRDPLVPGAGTVDGLASTGSESGPESASVPGPEHGDRLVVTRRIPPREPTPVALPPDPRAVVVAGDGAGPAARAFAETHRLPLLAEPSSGSRGGPSMVTGYPQLLAQVMADPDHPLRPSQAIVYGHPTLSRPVVGALLGAADVETIIVDPTSSWADASRTASLVVPALALGDADDRADAAARLEDWRREGALLVEASEPTWQQRAALAVWGATGEEDTLVLGSSSLVRDLEQLAPAARGTVLAGRGLAGIDGMASTAGGYALANEHAPDEHAAAEHAPAGRVRLLVGDVTALHDFTGLIVGPLERRPALDVIVVDDSGGRIFSGLEHRRAHPGLLERFFTTPHGADIAAAARALGVDAVRYEGPQALDALVRGLERPTDGLRMIVVGP
ncbi:2-succinyl-5-enolpyruvyl-6-hydroxy-3-cyclohexene-1-carboxylic-acid synthase [Brachybacterium halotolerans subsp. kimchii]|uniref:2-succinyl-5-enolpyruvyl-6-hydroxy-3- cyclohexene-1-carboxylic-acid synthase n=1 Tax=Brachybacterium halotolerans TaxID=2795215 RepID=UPI001E430AC1|nr:2-succinyl-5-enolpyruvyl-6-hydroxy-3-cyclohexene-1-carboxylic-acid synthase [Brachybacterium halotolerans]UEJ82270.1 2-succinyl-5-enolpyruvyl-6-hydroxy-3-cyclohexene-1-carboxylic-acid synthase [Brachybacterium halotolerans subsp. kimchii]